MRILLTLLTGRQIRSGAGVGLSLGTLLRNGTFPLPRIESRLKVFVNPSLAQSASRLESLSIALAS